MTRSELILYATPTGPLADAVADTFRRVSTATHTTAQDYPPHCTLTGFFRRSPGELPRIRAELDEVLAAVGPAPVHAVDVVGLRREPKWIGLELRSEWLLDLTARFVARHRVDPGDDPLRPKDWLHLSLAYGEGDLDAAGDCIDDIGTDGGSPWEVALWQRHGDGRWIRHDAAPTEPGGIDG